MSTFTIIKEDGHRGSGRTHKQIENAPRGATFIHPAPDYAKMIANKIDRYDLQFLGCFARPEQLIGLSHVVIDHSLRVNDPDLRTYLTRGAAA